ncbi:uncharacterized protein EV422DRAFT_617256 [Fimicolochytrium jonesii]|uniref:uncharacterized protein n=1 Tax=Fimicolochytrium jonesii TaxID=1396493 RepID=UPI0022FF221C|nr:uncharacterized protein EV422DRAFT_617256 [Fimicolochytrium jonesii]KAI8824776.1 hypothetical protein EV422DRAFT_617256 [Fimicolochytrium jonesii]
MATTEPLQFGSVEISVWNGKVVLYGAKGVVDNGANTNSVWLFDPAARSWNVLSPNGNAPFTGENHDAATAVVAGDALYVVAALNTRGWWRYDLVSGTWTSMSGAPTAVLYPTMVGTSSTLYYGGGYNYLGNNRKLSDFWKYTPSSGAWTRLPSFLYEVNRSPGALVGNDMYHFGGFLDTFTNSLQRWTASPEGASWQSRNLPGAPSAREGGCLTSVGSSLIYFGGRYGSSIFYDDLYMLDTPSGSSWTNLTPSVSDQAFFPRLDQWSCAAIGPIVYISGHLRDNRSPVSQSSGPALFGLDTRIWKFFDAANGTTPYTSTVSSTAYPSTISVTVVSTTTTTRSVTQTTTSTIPPSTVSVTQTTTSTLPPSSIWVTDTTTTTAPPSTVSVTDTTTTTAPPSTVSVTDTTTTTAPPSTVSVTDSTTTTIPPVTVTELTVTTVTEVSTSTVPPSTITKTEVSTSTVPPSTITKTIISTVPPSTVTVTSTLSPSTVSLTQTITSTIALATTTVTGAGTTTIAAGDIPGAGNVLSGLGSGGGTTTTVETTKLAVPATAGIAVGGVALGAVIVGGAMFYKRGAAARKGRAAASTLSMPALVAAVPAAPVRAAVEHDETTAATADAEQAVVKGQQVAGPDDLVSVPIDDSPSRSDAPEAGKSRNGDEKRRRNIV